MTTPVCPDGEPVHDESVHGRPEAVFSATIGRQKVANPSRESRRTGRVLAGGGRQSGAINRPRSVLSGTDSAGIPVCGRQESCACIDDSGMPATICWRALIRPESSSLIRPRRSKSQRAGRRWAWPPPDSAACPPRTRKRLVRHAPPSIEKCADSTRRGLFPGAPLEGSFR